ncbi:MAG: hypothetical protein ACYTG4_00020 [Planctomycetota bacterium]
MVGITQEQHPDRCRLFMQWKQMDFPILVDSLNRTGTKAVPTFTLLDEHGIVRDRRPNPRMLAEFVERTWDAPEKLPSLSSLPEMYEKGDALTRGDILFLGAGRPESLPKALVQYRQALGADPSEATAWFRLGVALCRQSEETDGTPDQFGEAMAAWKIARALDPGQYIWRRRIQQYGPLLDKPYPFYDWVETARAEIRARGETPVRLTVEPRGSELAGKGAMVSNEVPEHPDPKARVERDDTLVSVVPVLVPGTGRGPAAYRIHLRLRPTDLGRWNNEAEPLRAWLKVPGGWTATAAFGETGSATSATSGEERVLEFDVRAEDGAKTGTLVIEAFYNVCTKKDGTCLYRRKDIEVELSPKK